MAIAKVEPLEGRQLLAQVLPSPTGYAPAQVAAAAIVTPPGAPEVAFAQFEPLTGRILVQFTGDPSGYDPDVLTNPANYSFSLVQSFAKQPTQSQSRPKAGVVLSPTFAITGVSLSTPLEAGVSPSLIVSINNNQPLRSGIYQFTIRSARLVDLAGQHLAGTYAGTFPSGNGQGTADFVSIFSMTHSTVLPALPTAALAGTSTTGIVPTYVFLPSTKRIRVRYTAAKPGKFQLAGGNNITLLPLRFQDFPGTFRLAKLDPSLIPGASASSKKI